MARLGAAGALVAALVCALPAAAAPGALDPSFAGKGWVRTYELNGPAFSHGATHIALQPDGKILAVGPLDAFNSTSGFAVFRYTADGKFDRSFGSGGWATSNVGDEASAYALALQPDGKIVVGGEGQCRNNFSLCSVLVRYLPNGAPDPSFGIRGIVRTSILGGHILALALQRNGRIVAAGRAYNRYGQIFSVSRFLSDGRADRTFSGDGLARIDFGNSYEGAEALGLQRDGKITIAGGGGGLQNFAIARYRTNGRLDRTFSRDGRLTFSFGRGRWNVAHALAIRSDGRIVLAGESRVGQIGAPVVALARLTRTGALDRKFGVRGRRLTRPVPAGGYAKAVLLLPDGRILVGGLANEARDSDSSDWVLARYTAAGRLDRSFGHGGLVVDSFGTGADWAGALARQPDGKIVAGGEIYTNQALARFLAH
jgi:uncharacterized delta-60 repeat protein